MIINAHDHHHHGHKFQKCQDYIQALQDERRKIQVFHRELPLCLLLVNQAIEACKHHFSPAERTSECNPGPISSDALPAVEEFFPTKRPASSSHSGVHEEEENDDDDDNDLSKDSNNTKSDWLRSVKLWSQTPNPSPKKGAPRQVGVTEVTRTTAAGAFQPFRKDKSVVDATSLAETSGGCKEGKKARRCWSPELHRRFLEALHQLGGSHVATPKQIRELMKVDGLTNDEVKSHLQKYRLHTRRSISTSQNNGNNNNNAQAPQFVVVRGILVPPKYGAMAGDASSVPNSSAIYTPIALRPSSPKKRQESGCSGSGRVAQSYSPTTSLSTYTTTASKA